MFSWSMRLNSNVIKAVCLLGPGLLFVVFAVILKWIPIFIEEHWFISSSYSDTEKAIGQVISKLESDDDVNKEQLIEIFKSQLIIESGINEFMNGLIQMIMDIADAFLGLLLIYFATLLYVYQKYIKKKT